MALWEAHSVVLLRLCSKAVRLRSFAVWLALLLSFVMFPVEVRHFYSDKSLQLERSNNSFFYFSRYVGKHAIHIFVYISILLCMCCEAANTPHGERLAHC